MKEGDDGIEVEWEDGIDGGNASKVGSDDWKINGDKHVIVCHDSKCEVESLFEYLFPLYIFG